MPVTMTWTWWKILTRRKIIDGKQISATPLNRVLTTFDLTALGIGSTLGVGVYVLAGHLARDTAGPAVLVSFLVAAAASVFAGLCYAEFGARVPRAGSAYVYSYVCVGELIAFIIGWTLILEYVIGSASVAKGLSLYIDSLIEYVMRRTFEQISPIQVSFLSSYVDYFAFLIVIVLTIAQAFGLKESSIMNNGVTILNLGVVLFVIIAGGVKSDPKNWQINPNETGINDVQVVGNGGFFPFGFEGMLTGAATCFYGFVGFDCIATTGEEVKNPSRAIPIAIILSLAIIFLSYLGVSTVVTLMLPYYLQDPYAPIPHIFSEIGWEWARWIVTFGGIFGLFASLYGAMFPLPRILYAMANDGLIFQFLGNVSERYKTPVVGTILAGLLTGVMAAIFDLKQLVDMMSIGTLLAYTIVASSVLILRCDVDEPDLYDDQTYSLLRTSDYSDEEIYTDNKILAEDYEPCDIPQTGLITTHERVTGGELLNQLNGGNIEHPTIVSSTLVKLEVFLFCLISFILCICLKTEDLHRGQLWATILSSSLAVLLFIILLSIAFQPTSKKEIVYRVPFVPLVPAVSILINIYLMTMLDTNTWIRFAVWMAIGLPIYFICIKIYKRDFADLSTYKSKLLTHNGQIKYAMYNEVDISDECQIIPEISVQTISPENQSVSSKIEDINTDTKSNYVQHITEDIGESNDESEHTLNSKKESIQSNSNEENVIALLDEILLNQTTDDTILQDENVEIPVLDNVEDDKKSRKVSTDTISSYHAPISVQHSALVHREDEESVIDEKLQNNEFVSNKIIEDQVQQIAITDNDENENLDKISDNIQRTSQLFYPRTPNISRVGSFLSSNDDKLNSSEQNEFIFKLNSLLIDKLNAKPNKVGLVKQSNYDSEDENTDEPNTQITPETSSFRDLLHKEIIARKRISDMKKLENKNMDKEQPNDESSIDESESTKPSDIRFKLEEIFKNGPKLTNTNINKSVLPPQPNNEQIQPTSVAIGNQDDDEDPNETSSFAQQLRNKKKILNDKNRNNTLLDTKENGENNSKENIETNNNAEESPVESETNSPNSIRKKLNLILATGPRNPLQMKNRQQINTEKIKETKNNEEIKTANSENIKKTHEQINAQKSLMKNVFNAIELNRKDSIQYNQKSNTIPKINNLKNEENTSTTERKNSKVMKLSQDVFNKPNISKENKVNDSEDKTVKRIQDNQIDAYKTLMSNVFKSIVLNRKDSIQETQKNNTPNINALKNAENNSPREKKNSNVIKLSQEMFNKPSPDEPKVKEPKNEQDMKKIQDEQKNKQKTLMNNLFKSIERNRKDSLHETQTNEKVPQVDTAKKEDTTVKTENKITNVKKISQELFNKPFLNKTNDNSDRKVDAISQGKKTKNDQEQVDTQKNQINKLKISELNRKSSVQGIYNSDQKLNVPNRETNTEPREKKISNVMKISQEMFGGK